MIEKRGKKTLVTSKKDNKLNDDIIREMYDREIGKITL